MMWAGHGRESMTGTAITVGRHHLSFYEAHRVIEQYTANIDLRHRKTDFYAWPYYDRLDTGSATSDLNDGDLLAPVLLNVNPGIHGFASLQQLKPALVCLLREVPSDVGLADEVATPAMLNRVAELFSVLDGPRALGVQGTTLSKVLHRKRPELVPLHDKFVRDAYIPTRIDRESRRGWAEYFRLLVGEMQADLRASPSEWEALCGIPEGGGLTRLRALDIIAWYKGKTGN